MKHKVDKCVRYVNIVNHTSVLPYAVSSRAHQSVADSITNVKRCGLSSKYPIQFSCHIYRPQTKFAKVMFLHVSVSHSVHGGACVVAGLGDGRAWLLGGMHGCGGHVWLWGGMRDCRGGACVGYDEIRSMSGQYTSYWNAFLLYL